MQVGLTPDLIKGKPNATRKTPRQPEPARPRSEVVVTAVFSVLIMWMAHAFRLRGRRVVEEVNEAWGDDTDAAMA